MGIGRAVKADTPAGQPLANINSLVDALTSDESTDETTGESISGTVGVDNLLAGEGVDGEGLGRGLAGWVGSDDDRGLSTLSDDNEARTGSIDLGELGNGLRNLDNVGGLILSVPVRCDSLWDTYVQAVRLRIGESLGLVTNEIVGVGEDRVELLLEELREERSGEIDRENLVGLGGMLSKLKDSRNADSQVVASNVEELGVLDKGPDLGRLQVLKLVVIGSTEISDERPVVASNNDGALAGANGLLNSVGAADTLLVVGSTESSRPLVIANTADVDDRLRRKNVLSRVSDSSLPSRFEGVPEHRGQRSEQLRQQDT